MIDFFSILLNIFKSFLRSQIRATLGGRYFFGVEFFNKGNIAVCESSYIEQGSRLLVINPIGTGINISVEDGCWIGRDVEIQTNYDSRILIEKNVSIQDRCKILGSVNIGRDSLLAPDVFLSSGNHYYNRQPELLIKQQDKLVSGARELFKSENTPIVIEEDCWLGKNTIVKKGVNIGRGVVIGANSVVITNIPPYEVWAGSPAKFIKNRIIFDPPTDIHSIKLADKPYFYKGFDHLGNGEDGFESSNMSFCLLKKTDRISLFLSSKIYAKGQLKIWRNDILIFDDNVNPGFFDRTLSLNNKMQGRGTLYHELPEYLKQYLCVSFEFNPVDQHSLKKFSINKIAQHD